MRQTLEQDQFSEEEEPSNDLVLGAPALLGIFFALALICAVFFGFGYTLGRKSAQPATAPETADTTPAASNSNFSNFKPSPASPASQPKKQVDSEANTAAVVAPSKPPAAPMPAPVPKPNSGTPMTPSPIHTAAAVERTPAAPVPVLSQGGNLVVGGQSIMVQIAAVSHPEDASVLTAALKRHGYSVSNHTDTGDKLIHVQIGPFGNKRDAEAMRQRLQGDGYNAILK